jgi:DNA polymerase III subunit chi
VSEIGFYHLTRTSLDAALPPLLGKMLALGERALILCASDERLAALDAALWACPSPDWLPHGTPLTPHPQWQPIYLAAGGVTSPPNGARFLFRVDGADADVAAFARVFDLFDGTDEAAVAAARGRWKRAKEAGHSLTYWRQGAAGWEKAS